ncbi:enterochelin esterase [Vagococcus sp. WN89Y]|uniref:enterochelin esterase n=1 Tax=Vagococcus sp. WN89Y TaxID=3457258 RepID=UPI003FCCFA37
MSATGSDAWWASKKGPEWVAAASGTYRVTFWWRDPAGTQATSRVQRVWLYITGVTDHHRQASPHSLQRIADTDVWFAEVELESRWRGSYCLIPSENETDFPPDAFASPPDRIALREGWRKLLAHAIADPLNPQSWRGGRGHPVSALEMPGAPPQPGWGASETPFNEPHCLTWHSARLKNRRRVWVFTTGEGVSADRPLAILLDGQFWANSMPVWPALASLTTQGQLPAAVYLLIDVIDNTHRSQELPCNEAFWLAVQEELLEQVRAIAPFSDSGENTVVAGQSFGGLSALYAGLHWPQRFGCVLSQSGSYWWPHRGEGQDGFLIEQLKKGALQPHGLRIVLEAGVREPLIYRTNQALLALLEHKPVTIEWRPVDGGHDALCWRGGLTAGLITLWHSLSRTA